MKVHTLNGRAVDIKRAVPRDDIMATPPVSREAFARVEEYADAHHGTDDFSPI